MRHELILKVNKKTSLSQPTIPEFKVPKCSVHIRANRKSIKSRIHDAFLYGWWFSGSPSFFLPASFSSLRRYQVQRAALPFNSIALNQSTSATLPQRLNSRSTVFFFFEVTCDAFTVICARWRALSKIFYLVQSFIREFNVHIIF